MKKVIFISFLALLCSCDDGDLQIESVDFEAVDIQSCGDLEDATETTFFFKIDQDEALLLNLEDGLLINQTSSPGTLQSSLPTASNLIYRLFSDNVAQGYFCDAIPPLEPTVIKENTATAGAIAIDTKVDAVTQLNKSYVHTISITDLSLTNDQNERLTDSSTLVYGDFKTSTANSAQLEFPFSNYETITTLSECGSAPTEGSIRLYKSVNDEYISLDIPLSVLINESTAETAARTFSLVDGKFRYAVFNLLVSTDRICDDTALAEGEETWNFISSGGNVTVETVENAPDANGTISYTHTIVLEKLILVLKGDGADINDVTLSEIESVDFGTYTTFAN